MIQEWHRRVTGRILNEHGRGTATRTRAEPRWPELAGFGD